MGEVIRTWEHTNMLLSGERYADNPLKIIIPSIIFEMNVEVDFLFLIGLIFLDYTE